MINQENSKMLDRAINKFVVKVSKRVIEDTKILSAEFSHSKERVLFADRLNSKFKKINEGERWGSEWDSAWFKLDGTIPEEWKGKNVVAQLDFNGEALIFSEAGVPIRGLTNGSVFNDNSAKDIFPITGQAKGGEEIELWVETAANSLFGINKTYDPPNNDPKRHGTYSGNANKMRLCIYNLEVYQLWRDLLILSRLYVEQPEESPRRFKIIRALLDTIKLFADDTKNTIKCREHLKPLLDKPANASALEVMAVGHAHIDTGWLWPVKESIRKCARTFATQLRLIEEYPGYVFGASQAQHYVFIKDHYPELYNEIKKAVKDGSWEIQGGMWVEADCNIISGESMVRQFIHGKNFFMDEFGFDVKNCWIPDVFGYSSALPQIMKKSGVHYFLTQKMSWNEVNTIPFTTFNWKGLDGSEVLTHFPPENNYNSMLTPSAVNTIEKNFKEKEVLDEAIALFGVGNGGGGPAEHHIENAMRLQNCEGAPKVKMGRADDFFERISKHSSELETWVGELYLEKHRGTLTTQAKTKLGNRLLEQKLRALEYISSLYKLEDYPSNELDRIWKILLLNQFHDIIPGSSIKLVYETTEREYAECLNECEELINKTAGNVFQKDENSLVMLNVLNSPLKQTVVLPEGWECPLVDQSGKKVQVQIEEGCSVAFIEIPAQGIITLSKVGEEISKIEDVDLTLENDNILYEFTQNGEISRAYDKEFNKEILCKENGNVLTLYEDRPNAYDAWDIDVIYETLDLETAQKIETKSLGKGPVRQGIQFKTKIGNSEVVQKVYLNSESKRLDFNTTVNWNEKFRMLRVSFPVNIFSEVASYDIQYGFTKRPTHRNTSWDQARFEMVAHKFADLSDNEYGVALLNDCKYGYKVYKNILDLNLLRSPKSPDPDADEGIHQFTYSFYPHAGTLTESDVQSEATQLNNPPLIFEGYKDETVKVPVLVDSDNVVLEVLKRAEKDNYLVIRLVERVGKTSKATIQLNGISGQIIETDLLEWNELEKCGKDTAEVFLKPFEIKTYIIK